MSQKEEAIDSSTFNHIITLAHKGSQMTIDTPSTGSIDQKKKNLGEAKLSTDHFDLSKTYQKVMHSYTEGGTREIKATYDSLLDNLPGKPRIQQDTYLMDRLQEPPRKIKDLLRQLNTSTIRKAIDSLKPGKIPKIDFDPADLGIVELPTISKSTSTNIHIKNGNGFHKGTHETTPMRISIPVPANTEDKHEKKKRKKRKHGEGKHEHERGDYASKGDEHKQKKHKKDREHRKHKEKSGEKHRDKNGERYQEPNAYTINTTVDSLTTSHKRIGGEKHREKNGDTLKEKVSETYSFLRLKSSKEKRKVKPPTVSMEVD